MKEFLFLTIVFFAAIQVGFSQIGQKSAHGIYRGQDVAIETFFVQVF